MKKYLKIHPNDNLIVALQDLQAGEQIVMNDEVFSLVSDVKAKHKFALNTTNIGEELRMYGILVGKATQNIEQGEVITRQNVTHQTTPVVERNPQTSWTKPDISRWQNATFEGYVRKDGSVGTANYWIVFPLVFCENRNIDIIRDALADALGQNKNQKYRNFAKQKLQESLQNSSENAAETIEIDEPFPFANVDGVKCITHAMGCGGTRQDAQALCGLMAGYLTNPNVAGATVLSLGCQNAQFEILQAEIEARDKSFSKPLYYFDQQTLGSEENLIKKAIEATLKGMTEANQLQRTTVPISNLVVGLECGGSDGFSGISANPTLGYVVDVITELGGAAVLAEFPELCGVEQELSNRCVSDTLSDKFLDLMHKYEASAIKVGSGFDMNPSPGNIKDGLITDAMKSAGAAKKGGNSPIVDILDYPEKVTKMGLNLLCTPGNDVESTTAVVASGTNLVLFTTGLGTPTGNPVVPVIKVASNTILANKMHDIIDFNTGTIIDGTETIKEAGDRMLELILEIASGKTKAKATIHNQDDFIPWKRGVSL